MIIKQFDTIQLKDGRVGDVMEISEDSTEFIVTLGEYMKWYDETIHIDMIEKVIQTSKN